MLQFYGFMLLACLLSLLSDFFLKMNLKLRNSPKTIIIGLAVVLCLNLRSDNVGYILKGVLFFECLILAGFYDVKTKTIPNFIHPLVLLVGLFTPIAEMPGHLLAAIVVSTPFIIAYKMTGKIGAGDIKLVVVSVFLLGMQGGFLGVITGLLIALILECSKAIFKKEKMVESFALGQYLAAGFIMAYLLNLPIQL